MHVPPSSLLAALSSAFSYPWNGLEETLAGLRALEPEVCDGFGDAVRRVVECVACFEDRTAEQLAYTRLFIGSFKMEAPPYASFYLEENRTINGQAAVEVAAVYRQFGIELDQKEKAPADHLRYLLAFLSLLARRYEETGEEAFAEAYADFCADYVLTWIDAFQALVGKYADAPYYPTLVGLIVDVLKS
jgi:TorA maturation chaperone TorD